MKNKKTHMYRKILTEPVARKISYEIKACDLPHKLNSSSVNGGENFDAKYYISMEMGNNVNSSSFGINSSKCNSASTTKKSNTLANCGF